jgi:hypothetical protein
MSNIVGISVISVGPKNTLRSAILANESGQDEPRKDICPEV